MEQKEKDVLFEQAKQWVLQAGEQIRISIHHPMVIETKSDPKDLVTEMDHKTERFFAEKIHSAYSEHRVLGEEGFGDDVQDLDGVVWIVDPIDGTMNFVHQKQNFAISIGIYVNGIGEIGLIYDVMRDILYHAKKGEGAFKNGLKLPLLTHTSVLDEAIIGMNSFWSTKNPRVDEAGIQDLVQKVRGTRSYGSAALEFAYVAEGIMDAYITMSLAPWDIAAGIIIVNEAGGITTQANGKEIQSLEKNSIITSVPAIHEEIISNYIKLK